MDRKQGRERGNDMQQRATSGIKPGSAAARTASVYGAPALPTEPPGAPRSYFDTLKISHFYCSFIVTTICHRVKYAWLNYGKRDERAPSAGAAVVCVV